MEKVHFFTDDGVKIIGNFWPGVGERGIVLSHMMPANKESWTAFGNRLNAEGFDVLAIDLRGHGESVETKDRGGKLDYKTFGDEEHQASLLDVMAAAEWLRARDLDVANTYVGGASIGANLSLGYMAEYLECPGGFALSPGETYRGIEGVTCAKRLSATQKIFIAAAEDDDRVRDAVRQARMIYDASQAEKVIKIFDSGGHGTDMLVAHAELAAELAEWLLADLRP